MTKQITEDNTTWISDSGTDNNIPFVEYENTDGKKWRIHGACNACGLCEVYEEPLPENKIVIHTNVKKIDGQLIEWQRQLYWKDLPGVPYACEEIGYENRNDIPMTPDLVNNIENCVLYGEWIDNGN
jgi:hypothetical protein